MVGNPQDRTVQTHAADTDRRSHRRMVVIAGLLLALVMAPFAIAAGENNPLRGGARNPTDNASIALGSETEIIADNDTYGTRQSNKRNGDGGGAIYGCRSAPGREPCVRAHNLNTGRAFEFVTGGLEGGRIELAKTSGAPLTTNATGVATGFNADRIDGKDASAFLGKTDKATDADKLDGRDSTDFASAGDLLFAVVNATGALAANRGATGAALANPITFTYTVTFIKEISGCSYTASPVGDSTASALGVAAGSDAKTVRVDAASLTAFHLQVIC
jgi:hypothetical protein